jgi:sensor histidine kinase regulating citrate/malate metabolism
MNLVDAIMETAKKADPGATDKWREAYMTGIHDAISVINQHMSMGAIESRLCRVLSHTEPFKTVFEYCHGDVQDDFTAELSRSVMTLSKDESRK